MEPYKNVFQFKISLKGTKPPVWRRIQVPETYSFYDFHVAIQGAMGWTNTHLYEFTISKPPRMTEVNIGEPDTDGFEFGDEILQGRSSRIAKYFNARNKKAAYVYDFGDYWEHVIEFEGKFPLDVSKTYPLCTAGRRACPPEDCGGVWAYQEICLGTHHMQEKYEDYDPNDFDPKEVYFNEPEDQ